MDYENNSVIKEGLTSWVVDKCQQWRDHFESNYEAKFDEYYRLWRGIWDPSDRLRESERSRIISPALQQAVESSVAEIEEATFGRGKWFDIKDDLADQNKVDIQQIRQQLDEDFQRTQIRKSIAECLINAAVFGTGMAELVVEETLEMIPATQPVMDGALMAFGVNERDRLVVRLRPVMPQNFLIDPVATTIEDALGVAIDEFVPRHYVIQGQERGIYFDVSVENSYTDSDLEPDKELTMYTDDKVRLLKYYGLVPAELFYEALEEQEGVEIEDRIDAEYIEAMVVIANNGTLLKVEENPYMMKDRPVIAFPWDIVPGRFWGRGVCEKGYNAQKALDTELRARIDALGLTVHPMIAVDASRLPRGAKMEVRPGKTILTNGPPNEIIQPFKFGNLDQNTFAQASALQQMVQMATGAIDAAGIPGSINGDSTAAGISMSLGAIIKRHKRTLINFQEAFLLPFVTKAAWRYMQFDPELYPVKDFKFVPSSSLGIIAREYEVTQLVQLLQTMSPDSPMYPMLIQSIVDNMNLSNREEILAGLQQASQPKPEEQQMQQQAMQLQMQEAQLRLQKLQAELQEITTRTQKTATETQLLGFEAETDRLKVLTTNMEPGNQDEIEFQRRAKVAELVLKERDITSNENIAAMQMRGKNGN